MKKIKYILDIGSSKITLLAENKFGKSVCIIAEEEMYYDGYMDGEFLSEEDLIDTLSQLLQNMRDKMRKSINSVVIGVPSEFCICVCKRISRKYDSPHKITDADILDLYKTNSSFGDSEEYAVINYSALQYVLDDNFKTLKPEGMRTSSLVMDASYILCKLSFINLLTDTLRQLGVEHIDFISTALGQASIIETDTSKPFAIVDVGHISTSISVVKGEGLALLSSFSMGGGHISSDIMQVLGMTFKDSELIKRKVILTIEPTNNEYYEVCSKGNLVRASINITNQIVKSRIEMIAGVIADILNIDDVFRDVDIYLTGDGLSHFRGVKNILKDITGHNIFEFKRRLDNSKDRFQTSKLGLASLAESVV